VNLSLFDLLAVVDCNVGEFVESLAYELGYLMKDIVVVVLLLLMEAVVVANFYDENYMKILIFQ
jgi:hypothetical protein